ASRNTWSKDPLVGGVAGDGCDLRRIAPCSFVGDEAFAVKMGNLASKLNNVSPCGKANYGAKRSILIQKIDFSHGGQNCNVAAKSKTPKAWAARVAALSGECQSQISPNPEAGANLTRRWRPKNPILARFRDLACILTADSSVQQP